MRSKRAVNPDDLGSAGKEAPGLASARLFLAALGGILRPLFGFFPGLALLVFVGALFWAKAQDPFTRRWFALAAPDHGSFPCVAVLPKPVSRRPVVVYAHGQGGTLMTDGIDLRQMAELGLNVVSLDYDQTNQAGFNAQWTALQQYLARQSWADTRAVAWVGCSQGANWVWDFTLQNSKMGGRRGNEAQKSPAATQPQLLVLISGEGLNELPGSAPAPGVVFRALAENLVPTNKPSPGNPDAGARPVTHAPGELPKNYPVLLVHGGMDDVFPAANTLRLAAELQTNGVPVTVRVLPEMAHDLQPERAAAFRRVGEFCRSHLAGEDPWRNYHSLAQWQAEAPALVWFWLPGLVWVLWWGRRWVSHRVWSGDAPVPTSPGSIGSESGQSAEAGQGAELPPRHTRTEIAVWSVAALLAAAAMVETALHLVPPHLAVGKHTLALARKILVQPRERADFESLAAQPIWSGAKLKTLLDHVQLAVYNRELVNWPVDDTMYRDYVLSPVVEQGAGSGERGAGGGGQRTEVGGRRSEVRSLTSDLRPLTSDLRSPTSAPCPRAWRRPLWEEFYPRIRHENSPAEAARIVARHLAERLTVVALPGLPHEVLDIWRRQITDQAGLAIINVAALRSVGVPARLAREGAAEFWDGAKWQAAPALAGAEP